MTTSTQRWASRLGLAVLALLVVAVDAPAQKKKKKLPRWRVDPITKNEPKAMAKLGYVSYGGFVFGQKGDTPVTTDDIDAHLHYEQILWVETPHFKIGSTLPQWNVPLDRAIKLKIREELTRMKERSGLSTIKPKTKRLTPWLRVHLFAQRLEEHYAEFQDWLGVTDKDFPRTEEERSKWSKVYMGEGAYLGQKDKYTFLLFEKTSSYNDYLKSHTGRDSVLGQQWNFKRVDTLLYSCAADNPEEDGRLKDDTAMHAHVIHAATHAFVNGYRHYNFDLPAWIREGLAHWFERRVSERFNSFTRSEGSAPIQTKSWKWNVMVRQWVAGGSSNKYAPFSEAYTWRDFGQMDFNDHVALWSRWDYLLQVHGKKKFAKFMIEVKGGTDPNAWSNSGEQVVETSRKALQSVYGLSPLSLDEKWADWVKETYPTR